MSDILQVTRAFGEKLARDSWMKLTHGLRTNVEVHHVRAGAGGALLRNRVVVQGVPGLPWVINNVTAGGTRYSMVTVQPFNIGALGLARFNGEVDVYLDNALAPDPTTGALVYTSALTDGLGSLSASNGIVGRIVDASKWTALNRVVTVDLRYICIRGL